MDSYGSYYRMSLKACSIFNCILLGHIVHTMSPGSSDLLYIVSYYMKWVTTSWTHSIFRHHKKRQKWQKHVNELLHFFRSLLRC